MYFVHFLALFCVLFLALAMFWKVFRSIFLALEMIYFVSEGKTGGDVDGLTIAQVMNLHLSKYL